MKHYKLSLYIRKNLLVKRMRLWNTHIKMHHTEF